MKAVGISIVSFALCALFASSPVLADDCSDALIAESCACRSDSRGDREQRRSSDKNSPEHSRARKSKTARLQAPQRAKNPAVPEQSHAQR